MKPTAHTQSEAAHALNQAAFTTADTATYNALRETSDLFLFQSPTPAQLYKAAADLTEKIYTHCAGPQRDQFKAALNWTAQQVAPQVRELAEFKTYHHAITTRTDMFSNNLYRAAADAVAKLLDVSRSDAAEAIAAAV
tara:strand:+ start:49 stop:462 length:414 start_codon:yes stop_codon:yes gene_type:complete